MSILDKIAAGKSSGVSDDAIPSFKYGGDTDAPKIGQQREEPQKRKFTQPYDNVGFKNGFNYSVTDIYGNPLDMIESARMMSGTIPKDMFDATVRDGGMKINMEIDRQIASHSWGIESMTLPSNVEQKQEFRDDITQLTYVIRTWK